MINGLRKKIVAINVVSVCIVFFVAMLFVFSAGYNRVDAEKDNRIYAAFDYDFADGEKFEDNQLFGDIALYEYNLSSGVIVNKAVGDSANLDVKLIEETIAEIAESDKKSGIISAKIKFAKRISNNGEMVRIVFSNRFSRHSFIAYVLLTSGALLVGVGCYFAISMILARIALKPVEDSWSKQKQFVADASHELKTPLSVIMANTEIIASHQDETVASQMQWIENTRLEAKRMAELVADLLFLAKNDDGLKVQMEPVNISDCIETTVLSYDAVFYENGKSFRYDIARDVKVFGNVGQLKQLTTILLDNANKYSVGDGNIFLNLTAAGRHITLSVSNDSEELSEEQLSHLFDRFYTLDKSRNTEKSGNGLGLSIAKMISQTHGGDISASYSNGRTYFVVELPSYKFKKE